MPFISTGFPGLMVFEPKIFEDSRGYFFESYNSQVCIDAGISIRQNLLTVWYGACITNYCHMPKPNL